MLTQSQLLTSTKILHERAQRARQKQSLLEARIMNAMSPFGTHRPFLRSAKLVRYWVHFGCAGTGGDQTRSDCFDRDPGPWIDAWSGAVECNGAFGQRLPSRRPASTS
jgi:hypothetical protein